MTDALVLKNEPEGTVLHHLFLDLVLPTYDRPGQFVSVFAEPRPAFFAIASSPGEPVELLVKAEGAVGTPLAEAQPGSRLHVEGPMGNGFPISRIGDLPLVLFVNGSGISAARPVIRAELGRRPLTLLYGVLTPDRRAFAADLEAWANQGVSVHTVVERPEGTGWTGHTGFVQDVAAELGLVRTGVGVLLVGVPQMIDHVRALYAAVGTPAEHVLVNY
jgi:sulfhydrogenase subunit gamma (sulfur reductase)